MPTSKIAQKSKADMLSEKISALDKADTTTFARPTKRPG